MQKIVDIAAYEKQHEYPLPSDVPVDIHTEFFMS